MNVEKEEKKVWGIHTQNDALFLRDNVIAIGWTDIGDIAQITPTREAFKERYIQAYPNAKKGSIATSAGMLYRFCHEVQIGDYIVFPSKTDRMVNIGRIESDYYYQESARNSLGGYVQQRKVKWLKHLPRTTFTQGALYELGSALSFFEVKNYSDEFLLALDKGAGRNPLPIDVEEETIGATAETIKENTKVYILKELSRQLKGYDLENFVKDLLEAMGYRATVSPRGGDRGVDIIAYKDELPPRILVQVKSQDGDIRETTIQSLKGAMREGDYGLFVTLSNYTKNAQKYLDSTPIIRGINGDELVDLILKYYDRLSKEYQSMIPLQLVYIPMARKES